MLPISHSCLLSPSFKCALDESQRIAELSQHGKDSPWAVALLVKSHDVLTPDFSLVFRRHMLEYSNSVLTAIIFTVQAII